jgi:subtilisin family serine protease
MAVLRALMINPLLRSLALLITLTLHVGISASAGPQYAPDEILVTFHEGLTEADCRSAMHGAGHEVLKRFHFARDPRSKQNRRYLVRIHSSRTIKEVLDEVLKLTGVEAAQPNYIYRALQPPDDTYYDLQWGLENAGGDAAHTAYGLPGPDPWIADKDIGWESAHAILEGMTLDTVIVGVLDTGIDIDHPDLAGVFWTNRTTRMATALT